LAVVLTTEGFAPKLLREVPKKSGRRWALSRRRAARSGAHGATLYTEFAAGPDAYTPHSGMYSGKHSHESTTTRKRRHQCLWTFPLAISRGLFIPGRPTVAV